MSGPWAAAVVVLWVLVMVLAVLVLGLLRRVGPALERAERAIRIDDIFDHLDGLPPGSPVPPFAVEVHGRQVDVADVGPADKVMLFVDSNCGACTTLTRSMAGFPGLGDLPVVVVTGEDTPTDYYADLAAAGLLVVGQPDGAAANALDVRAFPYAVAIAAGGTVVAGRVPGSPEDLVRLTSELHADPASAPEGDAHVPHSHHH